MKLINKGIYILSLLLLSIPFACTEEEDFGVIAGLDFTVATLNADGTKTGVLPLQFPETVVSYIRLILAIPLLKTIQMCSAQADLWLHTAIP